MLDTILQILSEKDCNQSELEAYLKIVKSMINECYSVKDLLEKKLGGNPNETSKAPF